MIVLAYHAIDVFFFFLAFMYVVVTKDGVISTIHGTHGQNRMEYIHTTSQF